MIEEVIRPAARRFEDLVFAGFSFDGPAQAVIDEGHPRLRMHLAHIRPDVNPGMNGLLKEQPGSQLFTVFGRPRTTVKGPDGDGMYTVEMEGVDVYDPVNNTIVDTGAAKVAAWFVDGDYDGRTFCITQAFFPDHSAWDNLSKALAGVVDPERFELLSGTVSCRSRGKAQKRRGESDRSARQRGDGGACSRRGREVGMARRRSASCRAGQLRCSRWIGYPAILRRAARPLDL
jgi:adenine-specific DNA-methyltransferase